MAAFAAHHSTLLSKTALKQRCPGPRVSSPGVIMPSRCCMRLRPVASGQGDMMPSDQDMHIMMEQTIPVEVATKYMGVAMETAMQLVKQYSPQASAPTTSGAGDKLLEEIKSKLDEQNSMLAQLLSDKKDVKEASKGTSTAANASGSKASTAEAGTNTAARTDKPAKSSSYAMVLLQAHDGNVEVERELFLKYIPVAVLGSYFRFNAALGTVELLVQALRGEPDKDVFNMESPTVFERYKAVLQLTHEHQMYDIKDRIELWLVSRCLRGKLMSGQYFRFGTLQEAQDALKMCSQYNLLHLGWFAAYDLGSKLATTHSDTLLSSALEGVTNPELRKVAMDRSLYLSTGY